MVTSYSARVTIVSSAAEFSVLVLLKEVNRGLCVAITSVWSQWQSIKFAAQVDLIQLIIWWKVSLFVECVFSIVRFPSDHEEGVPLPSKKG